MKIAIYISSHGYGHATRMAALARAFQVISIEIVLCTDRPHFLFEDIHSESFSLREVSIDRGVVHEVGLKTDLIATKTAILDLFAQREEIVARESDFLRSTGIDLVIADIPFFIVEAAAYASVPIFGVSNFDWSYIYEEIFKEDQSLKPVINVIRSLYRRMDRSYLLQMGNNQSVPGFRNPHRSGLIARKSSSTKNIREIYDIAAEAHILLVSFGGEGSLNIDMDKLCQAWDGVVLSSYMLASCPNHIRVSTDEDYLSLIAAADLVICKPGYSTFSEILSMGKAMIYLPRKLYPEERVLIEGIRDYPAAIEIDKIPESISELRSLLSSMPESAKPVPIMNHHLASQMLSDYHRLKTPEDRLISVFDLGSNNMNYILYNKSKDILLHRAWCTTGLGRDFDGQRISEENMSRALKAMKPIMELDSKIDSQKELIATGICRKADNAEDFLQRIKQSWPIKTKIIPAKKEIRFAWMATDKASIEPSRRLVIDIGGASTEVAWKDQQGVLQGTSLDFGLQSLLRAYPSRKTALERVKEGFDQLPPKTDVEIVAVGLTATILSQALIPMTNDSLLDSTGTWISIDSLKSFGAEIYQHNDTEANGIFASEYEMLSLQMASSILELLLDRYHCCNFMALNDGLSLGYAKWIK